MSDAGSDRQHPALILSEVKIRLVDKRIDDLIGWASCVVNGALHLNNISIRRSPGGPILLRFPGKCATSGQTYFFFNPISSEAKEAFDTAILGRLRDMGTP